MSTDLVRCRASFVAKIKAENFYSDGAPWSLRQHWHGAADGFADDQLQRRWLDFKSGWITAQEPQPAAKE